MKTTIIANPNAGSAERLSAIRRAVRQKASTKLVESEAPGDVGELARRAVGDGAELVVAAGGDGTVHEVVNALATDLAGARFSVIPLGTGNDLCRTLDVPLDPAQALDAIEDGTDQPFDVLHAELADGSEVFAANALAGGLSGKAAELITPELKERFGPFAYWIIAPEALREVPRYTVGMTLDGEEVGEIAAISVFFANASSVGGGFEVAPGASPHDGLMDVVIVRDGNALQLAEIAARLTSGDILGSDSVDYHPAKRAELTTSPAMEFNADGELLPATPRRVTVRSGALTVRVPRRDLS